MTDPILPSTATFRRAVEPEKHGQVPGGVGGGRGRDGGGGAGGFTPGTVLLGRYRIVHLLGKGGMGEVYRADDLKLGEPVALKFLSSAATSNPRALDRLYRELRNGRQVSHPNVCRLYDVAEVDGRFFITMEFVGGEDLASLLSRIGRLPAEKALRVSRDLCAGVAAAHQVGLLHRDLKPANIMIDGRGAAKITDFGIAAFSTEISQDELCGTPNYMAPEQLLGGIVSVPSDLYALGLVIFELFTGTAVFASDSVQDLIAAHKAEKRRPSTIVSDIDLIVERVILKCLKEDRAERPQSAREILSMLPGRDAIDAAVAAGETPSPQIVAAADVSSTLSRRKSALLFAAVVIGLAAILLLTPITMFYAHVPLDKSPEVLAEGAQQIAATVGMPTKGLRRYSWFERDEKYLRSESASRGASWQDLRSMIPGAMEYVSYWAPIGVTPQNSTGRLRFESPLLLNHFNRLVLDSEGRLKSFRFGDATSSSPDYRAPAMQTLLALAGLGEQSPTLVGHHRTGEDSESAQWVAQVGPRDPVHIRLSTRTGAIVAFDVTRFGSSSNDHGSPFAAALGLAPAWSGAALIVLIVVTAVIGIGLMLRNARHGRVDQSGALKLAAYIAAACALSWACGADHSGRLQGEWEMLTAGIGGALFRGILVWLLYAALEPSLRRRSPHVLVAWSRLMLGRFHDPLVARDVLIAICLGVGWNLWWRLINLSPKLWGLPALLPYGNLFEAFSSVRGVAFRFFSLQNTAVLFGLGIVFILSSWRALTHRTWISFLGTGALIVLIAYPTIPQVHPKDIWFVGVFSLGIAASFFLVASRLGLLALVVAIFVHFQLCGFPLTYDFDSWFAGRSWLAIVLLLAVAAWAALTSLPSQGRLAAD